MFTRIVRAIALSGTLAGILASESPASAGGVPIGKPTPIAAPKPSAILTSTPAQSSASFPLYCQAPLHTTGGIKTSPSWIWAAKPAKEAAPLPGQCAWPDRLQQPGEIDADAAEFGGPPGPPYISVLCPLNARVASQIAQFSQNTFFSIQVQNAPFNNQIEAKCFNATAPPVLLTPQTRPWPVLNNPSPDPRAPVH
jgi:hypothetical protein